MKIQGDSFYICRYFYLFLYETKEAAILAKIKASPMAGYEYAPSNAAGIQGSERIARNFVRDWSHILKAKVSVLLPSQPILLLSVENDKICKVIVGEKIGWIIAEDWLRIDRLERHISGIIND